MHFRNSMRKSRIWWKKLTTAGISDVMTISQKNAVRFSNIVILISLLGLSINFFQNLIDQEWRDVRDVGFACLAFLSFYQMNRIGLHLIAKLLTIVIPTLIFTFFYIDSGVELNVVPAYMTMILFVIFCFQNKLLKIGLVAFVLSAYAFAHYSFVHLDWMKNGHVPVYLSYLYFVGSIALAVILIEMLISEKQHFINHTEGLLDEVHSKNEELESFTFVSSHNLKSPLRTINSFAALLERSLEEKDFEKSKYYLKYVKEASRRMFNLTEDILSYARLSDLHMDFTSVSFQSILNDIQFELQTCSPRPFELKVTGNPQLTTNVSLCKVLFENLIENSIKYNDNEVATIEIRHRIEDGMHVFRVQDNGIGIDKSHQNQIFQMFRRLHNDDEYEGTGIGLAICQKIVTLLDGELGLYSTVGDGTTFVVKLPQRYTNAQHDMESVPKHETPGDTISSPKTLATSLSSRS